MEYCSRQCIRRTFYAVIIGTSPIIICLLLIALARLILNRLETIYYRRQKVSDRRRSSSVYHQVGRSILSYTPISTTELQRIIQGKQATESLSTSPKSDSSSPKTSKFMKSILTRREPSPPTSTNTLANLVIRRNAIASTPLAALLVPVLTSVTPTLNIINEQQRINARMIKHESGEPTTLSNNTDFFNTNDSFDGEQQETDPFVSSRKTMPTTVVVEEFPDFHSVHSVPYSLNLVNSVI
jgi:hypothetical protein